MMRIKYKFTDYLPSPSPLANAGRWLERVGVRAARCRCQALFSLLFFLPLFWGCQEDLAFDEQGMPVFLIPTMDEPETGDAADTRVLNQTWYTTDIVGVAMAGTGVTDTGYKQYKPSASGTSVTLSPTAAAQTLYYPVNGNAVTFTAFCPYQAPSSGVVTYSTFADQSTSAKMQAVDLIYHTGATGKASSPTANLSFTHKFSKLTINVTRGTNVTDALTGLAMTVTGVPTKATCTLSDGAVAVSTASTVTPFHENVAATGKATAIIPPHTSSGYATRTITFKVGSLNYSYTIPSSFTFAAGSEYTFNFTLTQTAPILSGTTITPWTSGTIAWDGTGNTLSAPTEVNHIKEVSVGNTIVIKTNHTATPGIQYSTSATSVTGSSTVISYLTQTAFTKTKTTSPYEWTLTYDLTANSGTANREGYIHITVGTMTVVVKLVQQPYYNASSGAIGESANCIVLTTGGTPALIPVKIANDAAIFHEVNKGSSAQTYTAPFATSGAIAFDAKVLWVDAPNFASASQRTSVATDIIADVGAVCSGLSDSYLYVKPGTKEGNAVVCITEKGTNNIIWSWHIWVVNATDRATMWIKGSTENTLSRPAIGANNYAFMPLNLGAFNSSAASSTWSATAGWSGHPFVGLYYQWGRKDPITNRVQPTWIGTGLSATTLPYVSSVSGFVGYDGSGTYIGIASIKNPHRFNWSAHTSLGWMGTIHIANITNNSWGYANARYGSKSPFDPCPAGWRVPPSYKNDTTPGTDHINNAWLNALANRSGWFKDYNTLKGYTITNYGGFYPAAGTRDGIGLFDGEDTRGYYWSAGPYGSDYLSSAYSLYFNDSDMFLAGNGGCYRYNAISVRCVAE